MWQPCYLATAECYSEIIDFTQSSDLVSDCIHSCWNIPYVRCSSVQSGPAPAASSGQPGRAITGSHYSMQLSSLSFCTHLSNALAASTTSSPATATPLWPSWESTHGFPGCTGRALGNIITGRVMMLAAKMQKRHDEYYYWRHCCCAKQRREECWQIVRVKTRHFVKSCNCSNYSGTL